MTPLDALTLIAGTPTVDALAFALLHFLWQGAALALAAWLVMRCLSSASARYAAGVAALLMMASVAAGTFAWRLGPSSTAGAVTLAAFPDAPNARSLSGVVAAGSAESVARARTAMDPAPIVVLLWLLGVAILSVRLAGGALVVRRLRRFDTEPMRGAIQAAVARLADRVGLSRQVGIVSSSAVSAPVLIGWLRPVILFPAAAMSGLSTPQLEALIAHELAHVKRHDYLVNLLQSAVETLLFYHPAVWRLSREIRREREHCCDDAAVAVCDRVVYASALTDLAAMAAAPRFALGATDGPLLARVRRILEGGAADRGSARLAGPLLALVIIAIVPAGVALTRAPEQAPATQPAGAPAVAARAAAGDRAATPPMAVSATVPQEQAAVAGVMALRQAPVAAAVDLNRLREIEQTLARLEEERHRLELDRAKAEESARRQTMQREIEELKAELNRLDSVPAGADRDVMAAQTRLRLAAAELELRRLDSEADYRARAAALEAEERQNRRRHELLMREVEQKTLEREQQLHLTELGTVQIRGALVPWPPIAAADATARTGDVLRIEIDGEARLPRTYEVDADGVIHLPLVGAIRVQGLTSAQVAEAIAKELADRRLAAGRRVTATLHRPR